VGSWHTVIHSGPRTPRQERTLRSRRGLCQSLQAWPYYAASPATHHDLKHHHHYYPPDRNQHPTAHKTASATRQLLLNHIQPLWHAHAAPVWSAKSKPLPLQLNFYFLSCVSVTRARRLCLNAVQETHSIVNFLDTTSRALESQAAV